MMETYDLTEGDLVILFCNYLKCDLDSTEADDVRKFIKSMVE